MAKKVISIAGKEIIYHEKPSLTTGIRKKNVKTKKNHCRNASRCPVHFYSPLVSSDMENMPHTVLK